MMALLIQSVRVFVALTLVVGVGYPLLVTAVGQLVFPHQANGSLIKGDQGITGSELLAQKTESLRLFWPRPSGSKFGTVPSGASNQGPTSETLKVAINERRARGLTHEMQFASGSGLDPHISVDAALSQLPRIVESRKLSDNETAEIEKLLKGLLEKRDLGFLGEERVNVLKLNLKLIEKFGK